MRHPHIFRTKSTLPWQQFETNFFQYKLFKYAKLSLQIIEQILFPFNLGPYSTVFFPHSLQFRAEKFDYSTLSKQKLDC